MKFPAAHPAVVGSIMTAAGLRLLGEPSLAADLVEVRLDALLASGVTIEQVEAALSSRAHPVLLTLRAPEEGGRMSWDKVDRPALYRRLLPQVEAIDIEMASSPALLPVVLEAINAGKTVVVSAHAFDRPPGEDQFALWLNEHDGHDRRTILKIAAHIGSWRDLQRLAGLLVNYPEKQIAVMGLGPHAAQSRFVLAALGSRLVYGWLDEPAAPGQPSATEVRAMLADLPSRET